MDWELGILFPEFKQDSLFPLWERTVLKWRVIWPRGHCGATTIKLGGVAAIKWPVLRKSSIGYIQTTLHLLPTGTPPSFHAFSVVYYNTNITVKDYKTLARNLTT